MTFRRRFTMLTSLSRLSMLIVLSMSFNPAFAQTTYTVQPQGTLNLFAYCVNQYGQFVTPCSVGVYPAYYALTGGHNHDLPAHTTSSVGTVSPTSGLYTGYQGLPVTYTASTVSQKEAIYACANYCGHADIDVKYSDISAYFGSSTNVFVGDRPWHPSNHFGTSALNSAVTSITQTYHNRYSCRPDYQIVGLNDMALQWGGVFDICPVSGACYDQYGNPIITPWVPIDVNLRRFRPR